VFIIFIALLIRELKLLKHDYLDRFLWRAVFHFNALHVKNVKKKKLKHI